MLARDLFVLTLHAGPEDSQADSIWYGSSIASSLKLLTLSACVRGIAVSQSVSVCVHLFQDQH